MGRRSNVQPAVKAFVGRTTELARLDALLDDSRLVCVVGPPGIGKTRVALEYAASRLASSDADVDLWFCDFTEARDGGDLCREMARVLGVAIHSGEEASDRDKLGDAMAAAGRQILVLDNCEQVADAVADLVAGWLRAAPNTRFLVTSRERLRVDGESVLELGALPLPPQGEVDPGAVHGSDAVQLFVDRARRVVDGFALTVDNARDVSRIVHLLDGMPLAIELAAARSSVLSPRELRERLTERFDVLRSTIRGVADRHRTLRAAIDWSWDLLHEWERAGLAQLSVFRGGFTIEGADRVVRVQRYEGAPDVLGGLQWLRDRSLVWAGRDDARTPRRFGLYLSIRDYAAEKLGELGLEEQTLDRHAAYYAEAVKDLWTQALSDGQWALLAQEEQNLIAAFERTLDRWPEDSEHLAHGISCLLALEPLRAVRGPWGEYGERLDRAIAAPGFAGVPAGLAGRCLHARGRMRGLSGRTDDALADFTAARELARSAGDPRIEGNVLLRLGVLANNGGDFDGATELYEQALALLRVAGDRFGEGQALGNLAVVDGQQGRYRDARQRFAAAMAIYSEVGDRRLHARTVGNLGGLLQDEGKFDEAEMHYERAIDALREVGDLRDAAVFTGARGILAQERGDTEAARGLYERAIAMLKSIGDGPFEALFVAHLSTVHATMDDVASASRDMDTAEQLWAAARGGGAEALALYRCHLDLALARQMTARGDEAAAKDRRRVVVERLDGVRRKYGAVVPSQTTRVSMRVLAQALRRDGIMGASEHTGDTLIVGPEARWFEAGGGDRVDLSRRANLRRVLERLARHRRDAPGQGIPTEALFAAGWPGESAAASAAANRVRVAVATLRKLGLREYIQRSPDGYALSPGIVVELIDL